VTTEHFVLQGARSATIAESTGRASMFLAAVSGGLVALGLVRTVARMVAVSRLCSPARPGLWRRADHLSPSNARMSGATLATWYVDDVEQVVDELGSRGVTFEHYEGLTTDVRGMSPRAGGGQVAWLKDPDGNTFAVEGE
jgi:hypothetical protein